MRWVPQHTRRSAKTGELYVVRSHFAKDVEQPDRPVCKSCYYRHKFGIPCDWTKPLRDRPPEQLELL